MDIVGERHDATNQGKKHSRRGQLRRRTKPADNRGDLLESFFEEGVRGVAIPGENARHSAADANVYADIEHLRKMLSDNTGNLMAPWQYFITHLGPQAWDSNGIRPDAKSFKTVASLLLRKLIRDRNKSHTMPSVKEIVRTYDTMGMLSLRHWRDLYSALLEDLSPVWTRFLAQHEVSGSQQLDLNLSMTEKLMLEDVLEVWRVLLVTQGTKLSATIISNEDSQSDWSHLDLSRFGQRQVHGGDFPTIFSKMLMHRHSSTALPAIRGIARDALRILCILIGCDGDIDGYNVRQHPFVTAISQLLNSSSTTSSELNSIMQSDDSSTSIKWNVIMSEVSSIANTIAFGTMSHRPTGVGFVSVHRDIRRALADNDVYTLLKLWASVQDLIGDMKEDKATGLNAEPTQLAYDLYHHFITAFMAMKRPQEAIGIWNHMIESSVTPKQSTWNAMLEGCKIARDPVALEAVWQRLLASGSHPDMICWNTRLSGLVECDRPGRAIRALEQMGKVWLNTTKKNFPGKDLKTVGDIGSTIKPSIANINAVVVGLLRRNNQAAAEKIIAWGGNLGIKPDIITFNTLLRPLARDGRTDDIMVLLKFMQKEGIQADVATFTTILDETLKSAETMTVDDQLEIVDNIYKEMDAAGVQANHVTFGRILYSLLKTNSNDMRAVRSVLNKMDEVGIRPNSHVYTTVISRYFADDPPDLDGVRSVVQRVRSSSAMVDHIFWDRVIEGYAKVGDTGSALSILGRSEQGSKTAGWWALTSVLESLSRNGEWELARQVVRNVRADKGGPPHREAKGVDGQHAFWTLVHDLGPQLYVS